MGKVCFPDLLGLTLALLSCSHFLCEPVSSLICRTRLCWTLWPQTSEHQFPYFLGPCLGDL
jgi:hypothetical protein